MTSALFWLFLNALAINPAHPIPMTISKVTTLILDSHQNPSRIPEYMSQNTYEFAKTLYDSKKNLNNDNRCHWNTLNYYHLSYT